MKMYRGVSDEGLARIAKTVRAQEGPTPGGSFSAFGESDAQEAAEYKEALEAVLQILPPETLADELRALSVGTEHVEHFLEERVGYDEHGTPLYMRLDDLGEEIKSLRMMITDLIAALS
jgi:hypothetical protein